jgi:hypothetical protein
VDLIKIVAPVVTNPLTVYAVVFLLILWAFLSGISLWWSAARFRAALDKAKLRVEEAPDAVAFASNFEAIRSGLGSMPVIGERWRDYCNSLIVIDRPIKQAIVGNVNAPAEGVGARKKVRVGKPPFRVAALSRPPAPRAPRSRPGPTPGRWVLRSPTPEAGGPPHAIASICDRKILSKVRDPSTQTIKRRRDWRTASRRCPSKCS